MIVTWVWEREREAEDCSFSDFSFSVCILIAFESQNDGCDTQQFIFQT